MPTFLYALIGQSSDFIFLVRLKMSKMLELHFLSFILGAGVGMISSPPMTTCVLARGGRSANKFR
jgi:hypothetical protein